MIILLVDDTVGIRKLLLENFLEGHTVIEAENGQDAKEKIQQSKLPFDLVITDFSMPLMNGLELAKWIKEIYPHTPVILMSTMEREEYAPADVFLLKFRPLNRVPDDIVDGYKGTIYDATK